MHILFVTGEYPPMHGGVGAYTAALADTLVAQGATVSILTDQQAASTITNLQSKQRPIQLFARQKAWTPTIWQSVPQLAHEIEADWIHVQYQTAAFAMNPSINLAPTWWRQHVGLAGYTYRVAWTYHDLLIPYLFPKAGSRLRRWVTARPARNSDLVIVTNDEDRQQLLNEQKVDPIVIPIGSNIKPPVISSAMRNGRRRQRGYTDEQLVIGYFGFLNRNKGGLTLIHTLDRLVQRGYDAHLLMIGERLGSSDPTNFAYLHEVETLIAAHGLSHRVRWTGHQMDGEVSADLAAIDVLLMPYLDGASLRRGTLMAGLAHGCAIVTTMPQGPLPELVDGRDLLYVRPENAIAAADAVSRIAENETLKQMLEERARRKSKLFTWRVIAQSHLLQYETRRMRSD